METNQIEHWKIFHKQKAAKERAQVLEGAAITVGVLLGPFLVLWLMTKIFGH